MKHTNPHKESIIENQDNKTLKSIKPSRIIIPILIGLAVVSYLIYKKFDSKTFESIQWDSFAFLWIFIAVLILVVRHLAYAYRLYILSNKSFSFLKCIELIFIWEFSSAVSPTTIGGSGVALFVLAQEKLSTARTATIVLYTVILDAAFFILTLPILVSILGFSIVRPELDDFSSLDAWGYTFILLYFFMFSYGTFFFVGVFLRPDWIKNFLLFFCKLSFLKKYKQKAIQLSDDMKTASQSLKAEHWWFHLRSFLATATAWSCRFLVISALIIGIVAHPSLMDAFEQFKLYGRLEAMFIITSFSPTPGGAGFVEVVFPAFTSDYVEKGTVALVVALVWRLISYYSYLIAGAIIIPNWVRKVVNRRKVEK